MRYYFLYGILFFSIWCYLGQTAKIYKPIIPLNKKFQTYPRQTVALPVFKESVAEVSFHYVSHLAPNTL